MRMEHLLLKHLVCLLRISCAANTRLQMGFAYLPPRTLLPFSMAVHVTLGLTNALQPLIFKLDMTLPLSPTETFHLYAITLPVRKSFRVEQALFKGVN